MDLHQSLVPSGSEILRHVIGETRAFDLDDEHFQIFELTDGKRNVDRLIEITGIPSFHVFKAVSTLVDQGSWKRFLTNAWCQLVRGA